MKKEVYDLIAEAQAGNEKALECLTSQNTGLIWSMVRKFSGRGIENDDLFQIGAIGLIKAIKKFDVSFDVEFSTYAVPMIIGEIRRFLRDDGIIKVSRSLKETAMRAKQAEEKIANEKGTDATVGEIAESLGCDPSEIALALEATMPPESIYKSVCDDSNTPVLLIDKLCRESSGEDSIINSVSLKEEIKKLPVRDRQVLMLRFYKEKTQSEVARILGLSQVQISRIEKKVLTGLREKIG